MFQLIVAKRITSSAYVPPSKPGDVVWVKDQTQARHLIEAGLCTWPKLEKPEPPPDAARPLRRPDGWPVDRFSVINRCWEGETVLCIGGGPSVTREAVDMTRGKVRTIAINNSYLLAPWAEICYFADSRWWEWHEKRPEFVAFAGQKCSIEDSGARIKDPGVHILHNETRQAGKEFSERQNAIAIGANSGYQALNIAALTGAKRVLLLGYDMRYAAGKKSHWHEGHPIKDPESSYRGYAQNFKAMAPHLKRLGIHVINCTPGSLIDCFERGDLAGVLADPQRTVVPTTSV